MSENYSDNDSLRVIVVTDHALSARSAVLATYAANASSDPNGRGSKLGALSGFDIVAMPGVIEREVELSLQGVPNSEQSIACKDIGTSALFTRLENRLRDLPQQRSYAVFERERLKVESDRARVELDKPFRYGEQLAASRAQLRELDERLMSTVRTVSTPDISQPSIAPPVPTATADAEDSRDNTPRVRVAYTPAQTGVGPNIGARSLGRLVADVEREFERRVAPIPADAQLVGRLVLLETGADNKPRGVIVSDRAMYIVAMDHANMLRKHVGESVAITSADGRVSISPIVARAPELGR